MSLRFVDSFDHYATAQLDSKWTYAAGMSVSASYGRFGNGVGGGSGYMFKTFDDQPTWIVGFAYKSAVGSGHTVLRILDSSVCQVELYLRADGYLAVYRNFVGSGSEVELGRATIVFTPNSWHYVELKVLIDNAVGTVDLYVDEVSFISLTNQDTQFSSNATANIIRLTPALYYHYDDIYVCDGQGSYNNDVLGDCKVECLFPSADGSTIEFTPSAGNNYENVDDTTPDDDATYNESETVGHKDLFECDSLVTAEGSVYGVQVNVWSRKDDAGGRSLNSLALSGAVETSGSIVALSTDYQYIYHGCFETSPSSGSIWTISEVNAAEFGYEVAA